MIVQLNIDQLAFNSQALKYTLLPKNIFLLLNFLLQKKKIKIKIIEQMC